ncbi:MAG: HEAT repeat domain-containing protein [Planctomycetota bacterium]
MNPASSKVAFPIAGLLFSTALVAASCSAAGTDPAGTLAAYEEEGGFPSDWLERAQEAEDRHAWEEAAFDLDHWALNHPPGKVWFQRRVRAADRSGDDEAAARYRREWLKLEPGNLLLRIDLADDLQRIGKGEQGARLLEEVADDPETSILALRSLGELYLRDGRKLEAAYAFERLARDKRVAEPKVLLQTASRLREDAGDLAGALEVLEKALKDSDLKKNERHFLDRLKAFQTGIPQSVADGVALLTLHPDPEFRLNGALYLARGTFPDDAAVFRKALGDQDPRVLRVAIRELAYRGARTDALLLVPFLQNGNEEVRLAAVRALGSLGTLEQIPALLPLLDPENRALFRGVRQSLEAITGMVIGVEIDPGLEQRRRIRKEWEDWWKEQQGKDQENPKQ